MFLLTWLPFLCVYPLILTLSSLFISLEFFPLISPLPLCLQRALLHPPRGPHEQHHHISGPHGRALLPRGRQPAAYCALAEERRPGGAGAATDLVPIHALRITPPHPQPGHY